jgi:hypothetical protein
MGQGGAATTGRAPTPPPPARHGSGTIWVIAVVGVLGLVLSGVAGSILVANGAGYLASVFGPGSVVRLGGGVASAQVEPGRSHALLVRDGSGGRCAVWAPDGSPVPLRTGPLVSVETLGGSWSGEESFTGPQEGVVLIGCEPQAASVRLVAAPDWSPVAVFALVALAALGGALVLAAGVALVVVLLRRSDARRAPPPGALGGRPAPRGSAR